MQFLVRHRLVQLCRHSLEVVETNLLIAVLVKKLEGFVQRVLLVRLPHFLHHDGQELVEVNRARAVLVEVGNELRDVLLAGLEAECAQGDLELFGLDSATSAGVEEVKGVFNLLLLRLGQLLLISVLLFASSSCSAGGCCRYLSKSAR